MNVIVYFLGLIMASSLAFAVSPSPGALLTYEGVLTDSSGNPITTAQTVTFQVRYSTSCILYEETQSITPGAAGEFSATIGAGNRTDLTTNTAARIFASNGSVECSGGSPLTVSGFATRSLHIRIGSTDLSPDVAINSIPFAINAQRLDDKAVTDFVQISSNITQTHLENTFSRYSALDKALNIFNTTPSAGQVLVGDGTQFVLKNLVAGSGVTISDSAGSLTISASGGGGGGTVTGVTASAPLSVANSTTNPAISLAQANTTTDGYLSSTDWNTFNGKLSPSLMDSKVWIGNGSNVATPQVISGDATLSNAGVLTLKNTGAAGTYFKVTTDAQGRVTSGASLTASDLPNFDWSKITSGKPTNLGGYGITDAIQNLAGTPSIKTDVMANRPPAGTVGRLFIASDNNTLYRDTGSSWVAIGDGAGASGITATAPLSVSGGATPFITITQANAGSDGYLSAADWNAFNNKVSSPWSLSGSDISYNLGKVGVGTSAPNAKLTVVGASSSRTNIISTGAIVDMSLSNHHLLLSPGGSNISLNNLADGAVYTLIVADTTSRQYTFSGCTNTYFSPTNDFTSDRTTYTILVAVNAGNTECYITWTTGFN